MELRAWDSRRASTAVQRCMLEAVALPYAAAQGRGLARLTPATAARTPAITLLRGGLHPPRPAGVVEPSLLP